MPPAEPTGPAAGAKRRNLLWVSLVAVLAMSLWFSAASVVPQLVLEWRLSAAQQSWLTLSLQLGFVAGTLASALLNLADRMPVAQLIARSALLGALSNAAMVLPGVEWGASLALRFVTGAALAGVYPPGMKLVASWFGRDRGFGIGVLVGALTLGTAAPHLLNALPLAGDAGMPAWRAVMLAASAMALLAALIARGALQAGPILAAAAPFDWRAAGRGFAHRPTRLANFGYFGHMWELYAMWTWVPVFLLASYDAGGWGAEAARLAAFVVIGAGALGCVLAGWAADRVGRTLVAGASLAVSGSCALAAGLFFDAPLLLTAVCVIWGFAVVADSAQFSAAVSELGDPRYVGTALTMQVCLGFLLSLVTIRLLPPMVDLLGWRYAFMLLAAGPAFGVISMWRLRGLPEARRLAGGRR